MKTLDLARFQKSRESTIPAGKHSFTVRRPTALDVARMSAEAGITLETACRFIVGWQDVNESDLLPGGDPEPLAFDRALLIEWVADKPDLWPIIVTGVVDSFRRHEEASEDRGNV